MEKDMTFEQIDAHVSKLNLADFKTGGSKHFTSADVTANPGTVLQKICAIYKGIRPILWAVSKIPLIPAKWRDAIKTFIDLMDSICA